MVTGVRLAARGKRLEGLFGFGFACAYLAYVAWPDKGRTCILAFDPN